MKSIKSKVFFFVLPLILCATPDIIAQLEITRHLVASGGAISSNAEYGIKSSVGQPLINFTSGSDNNLWLGFWNTNQSLVDVNDKELLPDKFEIFQNFPNPFNPSTQIKYSIPEISNVRLEIFNVLGERISILVNQIREPGFYITKFNASNLASGLYIYRIHAKSVRNDSKQNFIEVKKMMLLK